MHGRAEYAIEQFRTAQARQPVPREGTGALVWPLVVAALPPAPSEVCRVVEALLADRVELGLGRYGHRLRTENGRNQFVEYLEERLDAVMYLTCEQVAHPSDEDVAALLEDEIRLLYRAIRVWMRRMERT